MSDANVVARLIDEANSRFVYLEYIRKDGTASKGLFHPKALKYTNGGQDSTAAYAHYKSLYNMQKQRWSKVDLRHITKARINGKTYNFQ